MAAVDYFLKLDGIQGESKADKHSDEIDVLSFSWGETQSGTFAVGGGGGSGKVSMQDFHFTMIEDVFARTARVQDSAAESQSGAAVLYTGGRYRRHYQWPNCR